jgi:hypothetical protein
MESPMQCSPERQTASVSLCDWPHAPHYSDALRDTLFRVPQPDWPQTMSDAFGPDPSLDAHFERTSVSPMTHKSTFTLPRCRLALWAAKDCEVSVSDAGTWHALVIDCEIGSASNQPVDDLEIYAPGVIETHIDSHLLFGGGKRINTRELCEPGQWCYVVGRGPIHLRLSGPSAALFLSSDSHCDMRLSTAQLEYWTHVQQDYRLYRPCRFTVINALWLMHLYAFVNELKYSDGGTQKENRMSVRYCSMESGYSDDLTLLHELIALRMYFFSDDPVPHFYHGNQLLPVQMHNETHFTVFSLNHVAVTDVVVDRYQASAEFTLLYRQENRHGNQSLYFRYQ